MTKLYWNYDCKLAILTLTGCKCFLDKLIDKIGLVPHGDEILDLLTKARDHLDECMVRIFSDAQPKQVKDIQNACRSHRLSMVPEYSPQAKMDCYLISEGDFEQYVKLLRSAYCEFCQKTPQETNICELRKRFMKDGVLPPEKSFKNGSCFYS